MPKAPGTTLACFSPPVMLFTFSLEFLFGLYVMITGKKYASTVIIIGLLLSLGIFQLAEYQVCGGERGLAWMRVGYAAITLLPPLGIHLVSLITKRRWVRNLGYALGISFISYFLFNTGSISSAVCGGNYILIHTDGIVGAKLFPVYYDLMMVIAMLDVAYYAWKQPKAPAETRTMLYWLLGGYAAFLIPTGAVYLLSPADTAGMPSVMCGFAVLLAVILTLKVYPLATRLKV